MKLYDALVSGRPVRKIGDQNWYSRFTATLHGEGNHTRSVSAEDLNSDDWEVKNARVEVGRDELVRAVEAVFSRNEAMAMDQVRSGLMRELGL